MKAIVIGAGIGGLSTALALEQADIECEVFEAVEQIRPVGSAISIWPNGVKCLRHLNLNTLVEQHGGHLRSIAYMDHRSGAPLTQFSLTPLFQQVNETAHPIARSELQQGMLDRWGNGRVHFGKRLVRVDQNTEGVRAFFADGSEVCGDLLVAADGTHSVVRPSVLGYTPQRIYAGYVNWNGLVTTSPELAPDEQWTTFVGEGKRVSLMPISKNRFYFFFDVPLPKGLNEDRSSTRSDLQRYFSGWATPVQKLIDAIDPGTTSRIEIHDIDPFDKLVSNRIALLGDAAHSTAPDLGQGGCMAMEDAVVMGDVFRRRKQLSIPTVLKEYEMRRRDRVATLVLKARKRSEVTHGKDMNVTLAWYNELRSESGSRIISAISRTVIAGPLG